MLPKYKAHLTNLFLTLTSLVLFKRFFFFYFEGLLACMNISVGLRHIIKFFECAAFDMYHPSSETA